jgi:hypothetical protein
MTAIAARRGFLFWLIRHPASHFCSLVTEYGLVAF